MREEYTIVKKHVLEVFDRIADSYSHLRHKPWIDVVYELISRVPCDESRLILDVGAGSGRHSVALAKLGFEVVSIDVSFNMLRHLLLRAMRERLEERIHVIVCDMCSIPIRSNVSTGLIAVASIHHIPLRSNRVKALREMRRVVKRDAPIIVTVWSLLQPRLFLKALYYKLIKGVKEFGDVLIPWKYKGTLFKRYYHLFTKRELMNLARSGGLNIINCFTYNLKSSLFPQNYVLITKKGE